MLVTSKTTYLWKGLNTMPENKHDAMAARTKELIKETFVRLVEKEGFGGVSVRNLTASAGINRGTFYLHYKDKYDLMEQIQTEILDGLQKVMVVDISSVELQQTYLDEQPYAPFVCIFQYLHEHGGLIRLLLGPKGESGFPGKMKEVVSESFYKKLFNHHTFENNPSIPKEYLTAFSVSVFLGVTEEWLNQDPPYSPEQIAVIYIKLLFFQPFR
ncbi:TetR/AcrR family transcriptional regulator [Paenibacillus rhizophilus]|uniref:TetR/AcrR family transcriptional regulator n=2 Tax=Paenibacillus rhizophilus TaxID=1850366 RepID=A0A3N9P3P9_9BACL|nr:TetR/AcrR family transcriptional regulator [Paenibacillus rhizophilus]